MKDIDRGTVLRFMREALKNDFRQGDDTYLQALVVHTLRHLSKAGHYNKPLPNSEAEQREASTLLNQGYKDPNLFSTAILEAYHQLFTLGYVAPCWSASGLNFDRFTITKSGKGWINQNEPLPEDPKHYLADLQRRVPNLSSVVLEYIKEALTTYERRAFFATAVMVGAASESVVYEIMGALLQAVSGTPEERRIDKAIRYRSLSEMFEVLTRNIHRAKSKSSGAMPFEVHENVDVHLCTLLDAIRVQRNDAVHPLTGKVSPESVAVTLFAFPYACQKAYGIIEWFQKNRL
jgi:hypothetical protein